MPFSPYRKLFAWVLFVVGLVLILLTSWPLPSESIQWTSDSGGVSYTFSLDWPSLVRAGEIRQATLLINRSGLTSEPVMLETRLEFNHLLVNPAEKITQPVSLSGVNEFRWELAVRQSGKSSGTLWIYESSLDDVVMPQALAARSLEFRALGPGRAVTLSLRWLGAALLVMGVLFLIHFARA